MSYYPNQLLSEWHFKVPNYHIYQVGLQQCVEPLIVTAYFIKSLDCRQRCPCANRIQPLSTSPTRVQTHKLQGSLYVLSCRERSQPLGRTKYLPLRQRTRPTFKGTIARLRVTSTSASAGMFSLLKTNPGPTGWTGRQAADDL